MYWNSVHMVFLDLEHVLGRFDDGRAGPFCAISLSLVASNDPNTLTAG